MEESTTYQAIIRKGRAQGILLGARRAILVVGTYRFGVPSKEVMAALEAIDDLTSLESLSVRSMYVDGWTDLLVGGPSHNEGP